MRDLPRRVCRQGRFIGFVLGVAALLAGCAAPSPTPGSAGAGLPPAALHDDDDARSVTVLTDDERPLVFYGDKPEARRRHDDPKPAKGQDER